MSSGSFEAGHEIQDMQPSEEERRAERERERERKTKRHSGRNMRTAKKW